MHLHSAPRVKAAIRVAGLGVPYVGRSGRGDLVVDVQVRLPQEPEGEELELLERLNEMKR